MKEAKYYEKFNNQVKCLLCPHFCKISEGQISPCGNRINLDGKFYVTNYGNPVAINIDPIEKKPLYHFYPGSRTFSFCTAGCNLHCKNCQNSDISQNVRILNHSAYQSPKKLVESALKNNCSSISYTYSEPTTFFEYMIDTAKLAHIHGLKNVLVSNGFINPQALSELSQYLDAANIDLKCFDDYSAKRISGAFSNPVLGTLKFFLKTKVWLEITNLIIPGYSDDLKFITDMCQWLVSNGFSYSPLHFSRFFPTYKLSNLTPTPETTLEEAYRIAVNAGLRFVYIGNINHYSKDTHCPLCFRKVILRDGYRVTDINIKNGKCIFCDRQIPGLFN
ncbi:MAG: AmmeMemoRadiSam system radical SAM enzyme [Candidatus Kapabacteria bacterium]|nr:AmmeMemoRadiSam system radical SAM enzyme [Candidatus Kapabacteria bacterium]